MNKREFLARLREKLAGLPQGDIEESLTFYGEMVDDLMDDGISEEDAVGGLGSVDALASQIISDVPLSALVKEKVSSAHKPKAWEIVLLALGSPIWLALLIAAAAVIFSLYAALWSAVAALWSAFAALALCAPSCLLAGIYFIVKGKTLTGIALIAAGAVCAGAAYYLFGGCKAATRAAVKLTKLCLKGVKKCLVKKEAAK